MRTWFRSARLPLGITEDAGTYSLSPRRLLACCEFPAGKKAGDKTSVLLRELASRFDDKPFSMREASLVLKLSSRSVVNLLGDGLRAGLLERSGLARSTRYRFTPR